MKKVTATVTDAMKATVEKTDLACSEGEKITQVVIDHVALRHAALAPEQSVQLEATMDGETWSVLVHADGSTAPVPEEKKTKKKKSAAATGKRPAARKNDADADETDDITTRLRRIVSWKTGVAAGAAVAVVGALLLLDASQGESSEEQQATRAVTVDVPGATDALGVGDTLAVVHSEVTPWLTSSGLVSEEKGQLVRRNAAGEIVWRVDAPGLTSGVLTGGRIAGKEAVMWSDDTKAVVWEVQSGTRHDWGKSATQTVQMLPEFVLVSDTSVDFAQSSKLRVAVKVPAGAEVLTVTDSGSVLIADGTVVKSASVGDVTDVVMPVPAAGFEPSMVFAAGDTIMVHWTKGDETLLTAHDPARSLAARWSVPDVTSGAVVVSPDATWFRLADSTFDVATGARADVSGTTWLMTDADLWTSEGHAGRVGEIVGKVSGTLPVASTASTALWKQADGQWVWAKRTTSPHGDSLS